MRRAAAAVLVGVLAVAGVAWLLRPWASSEDTEPAPASSGEAEDAPAPDPRLSAAARAGRGASPAARTADGLAREDGVALGATGTPVPGERGRAAGAPADPAVTGAEAPGASPRGVADGSLAARGPAEAAASGARADPAAAWTISGRVEDAEDHAAIEGVRVTVSPAASPDVPLPGLATTGGDGAFSVPVPAAGSYVLHVGAPWTPADAPGAEHVAADVPGVAAGTAGLVVGLARGLAIEGRVVGDDGDLVAFPIAVEAIGRTPSGDSDYTRRRFVRMADGSLRLSGLAPGRYDLSLRPDAKTGAQGRSTASPTVVRDVAAGTTGSSCACARGSRSRDASWTRRASPPSATGRCTRTATGRCAAARRAHRGALAVRVQRPVAEGGLARLVARASLKHEPRAQAPGGARRPRGHARTTVGDAVRASLGTLLASGRSERS